MIKRNFAIAAIAATIIASCSADRSQQGEYSATSETTDSASNAGSNAGAAEKMTKTADMRFRVKDVQQTKEDLGKVIKSKGGLVIEVNISSNINNTEKVKFSADSLKEITSYSKEGFMVAKIPSSELDGFTNNVANAAVFVDTQSLRMEDKTLSYLSNKLKSDNAKEAVTELKKTNIKKGSNVETSLYIKDGDVDRKIENISIDNQVRFSTITLSFYQDNTIKTMIVANDHLYDYKPNFFRRLALNFVDGLSYFKEVVLFLASLWLFIAIGIAAYFGFKYYKKSTNKNVN